MNVLFRNGNLVLVLYVEGFCLVARVFSSWSLRNEQVNQVRFRCLVLKRLSGCCEFYMLYFTLGFVAAQVCISGWSTFRFLETSGTGDAELVGLWGSEFQALRVVSPAGKPVARLC